jgi:hypothetical protein
MRTRSALAGLVVTAGLAAGCSATRTGETQTSTAVVPVGAGMNAIGMDMAGMDMQSGTGAHPEHGLVLTTTTDHYLIVLDILAPEDMFMPAEVASQHPGAGELVVDGKATPTVGVNLRHMEVHIYDRTTGDVVTGQHPTLTLTDHTAGSRASLDATEMRDLIIGEIDDHYGSNSSVAVGHDFTIRVAINGDAADFSGVVK